MINIRFGFDHTDMYMGVSWGLDYMAHVFRECPVTGETQRAEAHAPNPMILAEAIPYAPVYRYLMMRICIIPCFPIMVRMGIGRVRDKTPEPSTSEKIPPITLHNPESDVR